MAEPDSKARAMLASRDNGSNYVCAAVKRATKVAVQFYNCQGTGHLARDCSSGKHGRVPQQSRVKWCYICEAVDHLANGCPQRVSGNVNGGASASDACPANQ